MPRKIFKRFLPDPAKIKGNRWIALLGASIHDPELWHLTKHSVAGAFFIGIFCAFLPIPLQTVLAALLAIIFKRNLALSVGLVFITNPLTMPPIFYFNYLVGTWILNDPTLYSQLHINDLWSWLVKNFDDIGKHLILGSVINGLIFGYLGYMIIHLFWIWHVTNRWRIRREQRSRTGRPPNDSE